VSVRITDLEEPLVLPVEAVSEHRLVEGVVITDHQIAVLQSQAERYACHRTTARFLSQRDYSVGELKLKLKKKGYASESIETAIKRYIEMGALDDARYAHQTGRSLIERKPCGRAYLLAYLQRRRIPRETAEQVARTLLAGSDETERATAALERRWSQLDQIELEPTRHRAYNYLARRGFSYEASRVAFENLWNRKHEG
ncbi:hypothetical protein GF377_06735, partial [candidate division GN15 bacterium]|nr:hypothetical protein [candidate division GN15 bacterium]